MTTTLDLAPNGVALDNIIRHLRANGETLATTESVTGGRIAAAITAVAGVSDVYAGGLVPYQTHVKQGICDIPLTQAAVSEDTARDLANYAWQVLAGRAQCAWGLSTTGVAGPSEADGQPAGLVWFGVYAPRPYKTNRFSRNGYYCTTVYRFDGDRNAVQEQATNYALNYLWQVMLDEQVEQVRRLGGKT